MGELDWASIITAFGTIILGYFSYNQYTKNKKTDAKIKQMEEERELERLRQEEMRLRRNDNFALVFGELWNLLYHLKADRVYIVQPHPLGREEMLTVIFEVKRKGVSSIKQDVQSLKISECANFASKLVKNNFMYIQNMDTEITDRFAKGKFAKSGCLHAIVKKLSDNRYDWVGSIFCEFTDDMNVTQEDAETAMQQAATNIQFILPEFKN